MPVASDSFDYEAALEACARGERFALRALYEQEGRRLLGVAMRIVRNRDTAQEVLQEGMLTVWQNASRYERQLGSARGWLYTVVRHKALDRARKRTPEVTLGDDFIAIAAAASQVVDGPEPDSLALQRCLEALDERKRECIVGAFVRGFTHDQISMELAVPLGTVKSWIRRGLLSLRECLA